MLVPYFKVTALRAGNMLQTATALVVSHLVRELSGSDAVRLTHLPSDVAAGSGVPARSARCLDLSSNAQLGSQAARYAASHAHTRSVSFIQPHACEQGSLCRAIIQACFEAQEACLRSTASSHSTAAPAAPPSPAAVKAGLKQAAPTPPQPNVALVTALAAATPGRQSPHGLHLHALPWEGLSSGPLNQKRICSGQLQEPAQPAIRVVLCDCGLMRPSRGSQLAVAALTFDAAVTLSKQQQAQVRLMYCHVSSGRRMLGSGDVRSNTSTLLSGSGTVWQATERHQSCQANSQTSRRAHSGARNNGGARLCGNF